MQKVRRKAKKSTPIVSNLDSMTRPKHKNDDEKQHISTQRDMRNKNTKVSTANKDEEVNNSKNEIKNNVCQNSLDDEIKYMIRSICKNAFENENDKKNDPSCSCSSPLPSSPSNIMHHTTKLMRCYDDDRKHNSVENKLTVQAGIRSETGQEQNIEKNKIIFKMKQEQKIQHMIDQYIQCIKETEINVQSQFINTKNHILNSIQTLQLYHDELCRKEQQYKLELKHCRKHILSEAQEHMKAMNQVEQKYQNEKNTR
mmetsp:Transcript_27668/g.34212  ORF Transcript_27668/g.34212 Transcript_27668/m.34212 type:complete len:256 (+) Transcript_27668:736-1503(+)